MRAIAYDSNRRISLTAGVIFIIAGVAALAAAALLPGLTGADYLTKVSGNSNAVTGAALLYLIAAFTSVGIAIVLYPILKRVNEGLALGSVVFRTLEAAMYLAAVVSLLSLLTVSQQFVNGGAADRVSLQTIADALRSVRDHATLVGVFAYSLGAGSYYWLFFQARLIPRWLSGWGIIGIVLIGLACLLALFSDSDITRYVLLILPIAVQEYVLAVWLIVKGFSSSSTQAITASKDSVLANQPR
jgi:hypothetical protein